MQVAHRDDEMNGIRTKIGGIIDVLLQCPDIRAAFGPESRFSDEPYRLAFALRSGCRTGFYDRNTDIRKPGCDFEFLSGL